MVITELQPLNMHMEDLMIIITYELCLMNVKLVWNFILS